MTAQRMRDSGSAAWRLLAAATGLGFAWLLTANVVGAGVGASVSAGSSTGAGAGAGLIAAVALVAATTAAAMALSASLRILIATIVALSGASVARAPSERVDLPVMITQSRPDAPGRPQPRAPGRRLAAA
ncbi:DUF6412 domain-containing protein [Herbiconiux sp. CPCC 205763]|uniref:DUF6412 domain-containing protein n=1 Tax=Herbiconiux aconitum TaxID=2970913 RepID=A0ABT2GRQ1_9MICO|nr:DUF6412 domain-containing protein [Herbiconiux aconitum]MCS5718902.1 DUF6412 domain-containing protein [Herbiconiux aconitum]